MIVIGQCHVFFTGHSEEVAYTGKGAWEKDKNEERRNSKTCAGIFERVCPTFSNVDSGEGMNPARGIVSRPVQLIRHGLELVRARCLRQHVEPRFPGFGPIQIRCLFWAFFLDYLSQFFCSIPGTRCEVLCFVFGRSFFFRDGFLSL